MPSPRPWVRRRPVSSAKQAAPRGLAPALPPWMGPPPGAQPAAYPARPRASRLLPAASTGRCSYEGSFRIGDGLLLGHPVGQSHGEIAEGVGGMARPVMQRPPLEGLQPVVIVAPVLAQRL